jgi:hypothetical protein
MNASFSPISWLWEWKCAVEWGSESEREIGSDRLSIAEDGD